MRDDKVTIAKAIGILLMVAAHAGIPDVFSRFIVMFHMPLFFFMSGYCFKRVYLSSSSMMFINKRLKGLYVPFVKWSLLFLLLHNVFYWLNIYNGEYGFDGRVSYLYTLRDCIIRGFRIIIGLHGQEQLLGGYWFLPQLLYASIIAFFTIKYVRNLHMAAIMMFLITFVTSAFNLRIPFWGIRSLTFLSTTFFLIGFLYKSKWDNWDKTYHTILFAIMVVIGSVYNYTSMLSYTTDKLIIYTICAIMGTIMTLNLSSYMTSKRNLAKNVLVYIGNNTLTVLTWHFLCFKLVSLIIIKYNNLPITQLAYFPIIPEYSSWWMIYFMAGVGLPLLCTFFYNFIFKTIH